MDSGQDQALRVLHVSSASSWRGGEQQLAYLISELQKSGAKQYVLCAKGGAMTMHCEKQHIPFTAQKKKSGIDFGFAKAVKRLCEEQQIDIIHTHDAHSHTYALLAAKFFRCKTPVIVSRRVDFPIKSTYKYNHKCVRKIICVSDAIKAIAAPAITNRDVLTTVHSGIDLARFAAAPPFAKLRKEYGLSGSTKLIGNTSALAPHKDYITFLETAKLVLEQRSDVAFFIIGDGVLKAEIQARAVALGIAEQVIFTGFRDDIAEILPELDVFLITSETEGLGTSIIDAFACKVPVVATCAGGIPELVEHLQTGYLSEVRDAAGLCKGVIEFLSNKALRENVIANASNKLQHFTKEHTAQGTLAVYREVLA